MHTHTQKICAVVAHTGKLPLAISVEVVLDGN